MKETLFKDSFPFQKWGSHRGLPIFLWISVLLHLAALSVLAPHHLDKSIRKLYGNLSPTFQARISQAQTVGGTPAGDLVEAADSETKSSHPKNTPSAETTIASAPLLLPAPPPSHSWFQPQNPDTVEWQRIYQEQQRNQIYQQSSAQIHALFAELPRDLNQDLVCSNSNGQFSCDRVLAADKLVLLKTIYEISFQQYLWQLSPSPRTYPFGEGKITFKF